MGDKFKKIAESGDWAIENFTVTKMDAKMFNMRNLGRGIKPGKYQRISRNGTVIMSNTPAEIRDHSWFTHKAEGNVLVAGLGLGIVVDMLLQNEKVTFITVIEQSPDVIILTGPKYLDEDKVKIIHEDIFKYSPDKNMKWDYAWFDIWDDICGDYVKEMTKLKRKFGKKVKHKYCWCEDEMREVNRDNFPFYNNDLRDRVKGMKI